jgi:hypothetical protein
MTAAMIQKEFGVSELPLSPGVELKTDAIQNALVSTNPITATQRNLQGTAKATTQPRENGIKLTSTTQAIALTAAVY